MYVSYYYFLIIIVPETPWRGRFNKVCWYVCIRKRANEQNQISLGQGELDVTNDERKKKMSREFPIPVGLHCFADDPRVGRNAYREWQRRVGRSSRNKR